MALVNPEPTVYLAGDLLKGSNNQSIYCRTKEEKEAELNEEMEDPFDALEVFQLIRHIRDPEHPLTLEELRVVTPDLINVDTQKKIVRVEFVPTVPHCSLTSLIGLCITLELSRTLPAYYKIDVSVAPGSHLQEEQVNQQLGDKERVAAAMENPNLLKVVENCIE